MSALHSQHFTSSSFSAARLVSFFNDRFHSWCISIIEKTRSSSSRILYLVICKLQQAFHCFTLLLASLMFQTRNYAGDSHKGIDLYSSTKVSSLRDEFSNQTKPSHLDSFFVCLRGAASCQCHTQMSTPSTNANQFFVPLIPPSTYIHKFL